MVRLPRTQHQSQGPPRPRPDDRRRSRRGPALRPPRDHGQRSAGSADSAPGSRTSPSSTTLLQASARRAARSSRRPSCAAARSPPGFTLEDLELILQPMVEEAKEADRLDGRRHAARGAVATSTAACITIFRQNFSQVTNPPIDSLRERRVMSLKTRFGNLGNILDAGREPVPAAAARSPGAHRRPSSRPCAPISAQRRGEIDCTFDIRAGKAEQRACAPRIAAASGAEAEDAVRGGATHRDPDRRAAAARTASRSR